MSCPFIELCGSSIEAMSRQSRVFTAAAGFFVGASANGEPLFSAGAVRTLTFARGISSPDSGISLTVRRFSTC